MRFARKANIFHGPLDAAPVAAVMFLLVIFMLLGALLRTPGVLVSLDDPALATPQTITVTRAGEILFAGKTNGPPVDWPQLRADLKKAPGHAPFDLYVQPGADPKLAEQVRALFQIDLPQADNLAGTDNPAVVVAVNFRGQCFYQNKLVQESELETALRERAQTAARLSKKLTILLWADKAVENDVIMRLCMLAKRAGVSDVQIGARPPVFGTTP
jgi:biopolymer transport protein ExbD